MIRWSCARGYRGYLFEQRGLCEHTVLDVYEPAARLSCPAGKGRTALGLSG